MRDAGECLTGLTKEVYKAGVIVETSRFPAEMEVSGFIKGETDWLWVRWSSITVLRFKPWW